ncbi:MAG TPA: hypothetical protein VMJ10_09350 [Kofleriaceae bacterium]|nr:hypothetical protein [Kofleriaceae bacterium]
MKSRITSLLVAVASTSLLAAACVHHADLAAPAPGATAEQRMQAYTRLRPTAQDTLVTINRHGAVVGVSQSLVLGDGQTVEAAEDLIPVVPAESPTAGSARRAEAARHRAHVWWAIAYGALAGEFAVLGASMYQSSRTGSTAGIPSWFWIGTGVTTTGALVGTIGAVVNGNEAGRETRSAFATYDDSLRAGLGLCVDKLQLVDCSTRPEPSAPPAIEASVSTAR